VAVAPFRLPAVRLVTYDAGRGARAGILLGDSIVDAWDALGGEQPPLPSVRSLLEAGRLDDARGIGDGPSVAVAEARVLVPIPDPGKLICIGLNYRSHAEEAGLEAPETPIIFGKFPNALVPAGAEVALPAYSQKVDYEAEVAFVIGSRAKDVPEERALDHIAGYTLLNDLSARDYQFMTSQWMSGKVFDGSAPCGPALVTPDAAGAPDAIEIELKLNGEVMQSASTEDLFHSIPALVAHLSMLMTLEPGDIVSTGTPAGVGSVRQPRVWLKPGDDVEITSPTLGVLRNSMVAPVSGG
jgi:2-keto-4-pentenoate hydratase/2-oxohepta-3-ene-1,7-dioic acid hydratase in catechol pathway